MSTDVSSVVSHFPDCENGFTTTTSDAVNASATTVPISSAGGYTNGKPVVFVIDPADPLKKQTFTGIMNTSVPSVTSVVWTAGTDVDHALGATVVDYVSATHLAMISKGISVEHKQTGTHSDVTADSVVADTLEGETSVTTPLLIADDLDIADDVDIDGDLDVGGKFTFQAAVAPSVGTVASGSTITPTWTTAIYTVTAQAEAFAIANPSGTPVNGQHLMLRIKDNGVARAISSFGTQYAPFGQALPTTTTAGKKMYISIRWDATASKADVLSWVNEV